MARALSVLTLLAAALGACSDDEFVPAVPIDATVIDAAIDAPIDAPPGPCGAGLQITGEYIDWDSTLAAFDGVENSTWTVVEPAGGATAMTAPNGRILLCITRAATSQIDVTQADYLPARFVADPAVLTPAGSLFSIRGVKTAMTAAQWLEFGQTYDPTRAQVLIYKIGTPAPLTLTPAVATVFTSDGDDDITWTAGASGVLTLFANVPVGGGSVTLGSAMAFTGPTTLPVAAGRLTIAVIR
jgi:hypothetical protein